MNPQDQESFDSHYAERLFSISNKWWKRALKLVNPYRLNVRRLIRGSCIDVGAGWGRNLSYLDSGKHLGVEPNRALRDLANGLGHNVVSLEELLLRPEILKFDCLLFSHVLEHLPGSLHDDLLTTYLQFLSPGGRLVIFVPQLAGFKSDADHKFYWTPEKLTEFLQRHHLRIVKLSSFPFPVFAGRFFRYNEWNVVAEKSY